MKGHDQVIDLLRRQHDVTRSISQRVVLLRRMAEQPPVRPDFSERPRLVLPELPEL